MHAPWLGLTPERCRPARDVVKKFEQMWCRCGAKRLEGPRYGFDEALDRPPTSGYAANETKMRTWLSW